MRVGTSQTDLPARRESSVLRHSHGSFTLTSGLFGRGRRHHQERNLRGPTTPETFRCQLRSGMFTFLEHMEFSFSFFIV
jgi:hypothetical protein